MLQITKIRLRRADDFAYGLQNLVFFVRKCVEFYASTRRILETWNVEFYAYAYKKKGKGRMPKNKNIIL